MSPSPCTSTRKIIRSLEISLFQNPHSAYKEKGRLRPHAPRQGKLYATLRFPLIGILLLRTKGRGISVPMHLDEEIYTQPRDFPHRNSHSAYKGRGCLRPRVPRQGKLYAALRFPSFRILILRIKGRGVSVPMYLDREIYTQPRNFPFQNSPIEYKGKGHLRPHAPRKGKLYAILRFPFSESSFCV